MRISNLPHRPLFASLTLLAACVLLTPDVRAQDAGEAYQEAYDLVLAEEWTEAEDALREFSEQHGESAWADDAQYWQCYVTERQNRTSEAAFACYQGFVEAHPSSRWADDAKSELVRIGQRLAQAGQPEYGAMIRPYQDNANEEVALAALFALQNIGDERALTTIMDLYDRTENERIREKIVHSLSQFDAPEATDKLLDIVRSDPSQDVQRSAIHALGNRDDVQAVNALIQIAQGDGDVDIRQNAIHALGNRGGDFVAKTLGEIARRAIDQKIGSAAAFALSNVDDEAATEELEAVLRESKLADVRKMALHALSNRDDEKAFEILRSVALSDNPLDLREAAVFALGNRDGEETATALQAVFESADNQRVRGAALSALANQDGPGAREFLVSVASSDGDEELARMAIHALASHGEIPVLLDVLRRTPHRLVRGEILVRLGFDGGREAVEALGKVVKSMEDINGRQIAAEALGDTDSEDAIPILLDVAQNDANVRVRTAAVNALSRIGTPAAQDALLQILQGEAVGSDPKENNNPEDDEQRR
ncbi:MAG: HEAT repeat domain-containing protein [Rhodothermales bacterium]